MNQIFFLIYLSILFGSFVCSLVTFKHLPGALKLFALLLGVTFVVESIGFYGLFYGEPAMYLYHFYNPFAYALIAYVFSTVIKTRWKIKLVRYSIPGILILSFLNALFLQPLHTVNSYASMAIAALFVLLSLTYYFDLLNTDNVTDLKHKPLFWISTGNLIFYAGIFFLEGFASYFIRYAQDLGMKLMFINYVLNFMLYTLYSIGFLCTMPSRRSSML